ncbi:MAG: P-loop NTPase [Candidatus Sericytochromatia bacterium]|nr:P-loop NTPase [Candidatus Tanganyikabacteria bacterium]
MPSETPPISLRPLLQRRWRAMAFTAAVVLVGGAFLLSAQAPRFETSGKLMVMRLDQRMGGVKVANDPVPELSDSSRPLFTQAQILASAPLLDEVVARLDLKSAAGQPLSAGELARRITVTPILNTDVIEVRGKGRSGEEASRIVSTLFEAYQRRIAEFRRAGVREGLRLIDEQLAAARGHLANAENKLLAYRRTAATVDLPEQIRRDVAQLADFDRDIQARHAESERARVRASKLQQQLGMRVRDAIAILSIEQNPRIRSLREQLIAAESSPLRSQGLGPENPQMLALERHTRSLRAQLKVALRGDIAAATPLDEVRRGLVGTLLAAETDAQAAQAGLRVAQAGREALRARMVRYPDVALRTAQLEREVSVAAEVYRELLRRREEARISLSIAPHFAQVIQPPGLPQKPVAPLRGQAAPVLALLALAAAFGAGILRELFDRTMRPEDLATHLPSMRVLATVPRLKRSELRGGELVASGDTAPHFTDALRGLGLAIEDELPATPGKARVIGLTSATPGEGKSVTAANLALCLAESGHRVLLVDGDRHRPRVHDLFEIPERRAGLSEILQGQMAPEAAVQAAAGIHVVPAGGQRGSSRGTRLIKRIGPALDAWREQYDFILVDLPPMMMFAEVAHFARHTDGLLLLAAIERIAADTLSGAVKQLRTIRKPVLGLVALTRIGYTSQQRSYLAAVSTPEATRS